MTREDQIKQAAIDRYGNNGNESQYMLGKIQAFIVGARYADAYPTESIIKWQTGKPKEDGEYLVTLQDGSIQVDSWEYDVICDEEGIPFWRLYTYNVIAWCKLSDIKPYKEETKTSTVWTAHISTVTTTNRFAHISMK